MSTESTEQILHMNGGTGDHSYAHNATAPLKVTMRAKPIMEESIKKMFQRIATSPSCLRIADLGCSSGANALKAASNIMDMISMVAEEEAMIMSSDEKLPATFQVFLNDLFGNDFNALFKVVPELHKEIRTKSDGLCFFNATPGSFFGRLFPSHSIHFFHSSFAVHWLTQGMIEMGKLESLRIPIYHPTEKEMREIIQEDGSFTIERLESLRMCWDGSNLNEDGTDNDLYRFVDVGKRGVFLTKYLRSVFEPILRAQLGEGLMDELFLRFQNKVTQFMDRLEYPILVLSLFVN
ncbi:unnamed protein product [Cuscuta epithymum]|uniref:Uncharacterized protein n=1 Tax=Cuscuta epithymum TaxID=186058 RepID=A0AAV0EVN8_9ASTE|nr:unnamed protein product [Cuscuta epithymum]